MKRVLHRLLTFSLIWLALISVGLADERPNVLFLFSDDQRSDTLGALGNPNLQTPALDQLVAKGTTLRRAFCMGSNQGAVCVPSRAMLMSGRTLFRVSESLTGQTTWPEQFAAQGYRTFLTGKWHNGAPSALRAFQSGKAVFLGGMHDPYSIPLKDISAEHRFTQSYVPQAHSVEVFADAAVEFLARQKDTADPFLCYVAFNCPHDPRTAPPEFQKRFEQNPPPLPANFLPQHPFNNGALTLRDEQLAPWPRTPEIVRRHLSDYYAYIEFMDAQIGRILEALEASGKARNTLVVFSSDHGLALGSHGLFGKQNLYEHSMGAPLIFSGPGIAQNHQSDALCYLLDIFPTLGELARIPAPEGNEGISLAPVLRQQASSARHSLLTAYTQVQRALREDRWKLIVYPQINRAQLFDLQTDPDEQRDLAHQPEFEAQKNRMLEALLREQKALGDSLPLHSDSPQEASFDFTQVKRPAKPAASE
jgi:arylsulfatase A-like enzyme